MPQSEAYLFEEWGPCDGKALNHIEKNFTDVGGFITPKNGYTPTEQDLRAITYLCQEWDYAYIKNINL